MNYTLLSTAVVHWIWLILTLEVSSADSKFSNELNSLSQLKNLNISLWVTTQFNGQ